MSNRQGYEIQSSAQACRFSYERLVLYLDLPGYHIRSPLKATLDPILRHSFHLQGRSLSTAGS